MLRKFGAAIAAVVVSFSAAAAHAAIVQVTATGTLGQNEFGQDSVDATGYFGTIGAISGASYQVVFTYDTDLGRTDLFPDRQYLVGDADIGLTNPVYEATLTINGVTLSVLPTFASSVTMEPLVVFGNYQIGVLDNPFLIGAPAAQVAFQVGANFTGAFDPSLQATQSFSGASLATRFQYRRVDASNATIDNFLLYGAGDVTIDIVNLSAPAGVPEPATWGLMIVGFGLAGAAVRRRRVLA